MTDQPKTIGILAGGGPAPGINGVIHAVTVRGINLGFKVKGFRQGFQTLIAGDPQAVDQPVGGHCVVEKSSMSPKQPKAAEALWLVIAVSPSSTIAATARINVTRMSLPVIPSSPVS